MFDLKVLGMLRPFLRVQLPVPTPSRRPTNPRVKAKRGKAKERGKAAIIKIIMPIGMTAIIIIIITVTPTPPIGASRIISARIKIIRMVRSAVLIAMSTLTTSVAARRCTVHPIRVRSIRRAPPSHPLRPPCHRPPTTTLRRHLKAIPAVAPPRRRVPWRLSRLSPTVSRPAPAGPRRRCRSTSLLAATPPRRSFTAKRPTRPA